jgi:short-subunit dehydrogenase
VIHGVRAAYPVMLEQRSGHIVNMSSLSGLCPAPLLVPCATVQHAVVGLSVSLRGEAKSRGVRVTAVCPGPVDTTRWCGKRDADAPRRSVSIDRLEQAAHGRCPPDTDKMARHILRALQWNPAIIVSPARLRARWIASRWFPSIGERVADRAARNVWAHTSISHTPSHDVALLAGVCR